MSTLIADADTNGDGLVDYAEFVTYLTSKRWSPNRPTTERAPTPHPRKSPPPRLTEVDLTGADPAPTAHETLPGVKTQKWRANGGVGAGSAGEEIVDEALCKEAKHGSAWRRRALAAISARPTHEKPLQQTSRR